MCSFKEISRFLLLVVSVCGAVSTSKTHVEIDGLYWLPLNYTASISYNSMAVFLQNGGAYENYRYANLDEIRSMFIAFGIPTVGGKTAENIDKVLELMETLGGPLSTFDVPSIGFNRKSMAGFYGVANHPVAYVGGALSVGDYTNDLKAFAYPTKFGEADMDYQSSSIGHWLVLKLKPATTTKTSPTISITEASSTLTEITTATPSGTTMSMTATTTVSTSSSTSPITASGCKSDTGDTITCTGLTSSMHYYSMQLIEHNNSIGNLEEQANNQNENTKRLEREVSRTKEQLTAAEENIARLQADLTALYNLVKQMEQNPGSCTKEVCVIKHGCRVP
eukprot:m.55729 g.55729  ORF g.55729 m.55729 type:complete len:336 (+) comp11001_c0_seq7:231-1238(+)